MTRTEVVRSVMGKVVPEDERPLLEEYLSKEEVDEAIAELNQWIGVAREQNKITDAEAAGYRVLLADAVGA